MEQKPYDHTAENVSKACGIDIDEFTAKMNKLQDAWYDADKYSQQVEMTEKELTVRELAYLAMFFRTKLETMANTMPIPREIQEALGMRMGKPYGSDQDDISKILDF